MYDANHYISLYSEFCVTKRHLRVKCNKTAGIHITILYENNLNCKKKKENKQK